MEFQSFREFVRGNVLVLMVSSIIWSVSDSITWAYISLYILSLGGDYVIVGLVNSLTSLFAIFLYPIGGYIADKAGRVRLIGMSTVLYTSSYALFALANSWQLVAIAMIYQQVVLFYMPAINALTADSIPFEARGRMYALTVGLPEAARVVTPYFGGYLIAVLTLQPAMRLGYTIGFALGWVITFIRLRYLRETIGSREPIGRNLPRIFIESYRSAFSSIRWMLGNIRGYIIVAIIISLTGSLVMPFWIVYAKQVLGLTPYDWGIILLLGGITRTITSFVIGGLVDRLGAKTCMIIGLAISIPFSILFVMATSFIQIAPIYLVLVLGSAFSWISSSVLLANTIPKEVRGRVMSGIGQGLGLGVSGGGYASGFMLFVPLSLGAALGGFVFSLNPAYPWLILSASLATAMVVTVFFIHESPSLES